MEKTPIRRAKSVDLDDPFTPIAQFSRLRTPRTSREFICPLRNNTKSSSDSSPSPNPSDNDNNPTTSSDSTSSSPPGRKRTTHESTVTPLQHKTGPPLLKKSSLSILANGFRTAASLNKEGECEEDPFGLSFRNEKLFSAERKHAEKTTRSSVQEPLDPTKCLPEKDMETYKRMKKLERFYDWQQECLADKRLLDGENCILSLPTGAGKTLIAEILMLREAIVRKRNAILVLPYVAIVQEKVGGVLISGVGWQICAYRRPSPTFRRRRRPPPSRRAAPAAAAFERNVEGGRCLREKCRRRPLPSRETAAAAVTAGDRGGGGRCLREKRRRRPSPLVTAAPATFAFKRRGEGGRW
uniref:DEAD/DEAH-box helicase domain-containing protein n=1 Tax=Caenorhabditis japonica TaxID=281687 RepID=A0A8R1HWK8_CAEJA